MMKILPYQQKFGEDSGVYRSAQDDAGNKVPLILASIKPSLDQKDCVARASAVEAEPANVGWRFSTIESHSVL